MQAENDDLLARARKLLAQSVIDAMAVRRDGPELLATARRARDNAAASVAAHALGPPRGGSTIYRNPKQPCVWRSDSPARPDRPNSRPRPALLIRAPWPRAGN